MNNEKLEKFLTKIEREWNWRQRELISLKQSIASGNDYQKAAMSRAGILLLYAHWEGFIKEVSQIFLECFANEDIERTPLYIVAAHFAKMNDSLSTKHNKIDNACRCLNCISDGAKICTSVHEIINTESNLNSNILKRIADFVGVNVAEFETRIQFIDRSFVHVRNAIAHGEGKPLTEEEFLELERNITLLMDIFKENIIDSALYANDFLNQGSVIFVLRL